MLKKIYRSKLINFLFSRSIVSNLFLKDSTIILVYHSVSFTEAKFHKLFNLNVNPKLFEKQIIWLKNNFNIISPKDLIKSNYKKPAVMITFDDGYKSYIENAVPILKKYKVPSINFLNMDVVKGSLSWAGIVTYLTTLNNEFKEYIKDNNFNSTNYLTLKKSNIDKFFKKVNKKKYYFRIKKYTGNILSLKDLKKLDKNNLVYFGNHLYNHYNATNLDYKSLKIQYIKNQKEIEKFKNSMKFFSYPFGQEKTCYNKKTNISIRKLGAKAIFSNNPINFKNEENLFHRLSMSSRFFNSEVLISYFVLTKIRQYFKRIKF